MASSGLNPITRIQTKTTDTYDHTINLVDTTKSRTDVELHLPREVPPESSAAPLSRKWTRRTLRRELARRKYAKWQQDKSQSGEESKQVFAQIEEASDDNQHLTSKPQQHPEAANQFKNRLSPSAQEATKSSKDQESIVDVLYENQRGWFLFGMPLYSAKSLLNLDPAPWQTSTLKDSPVNITNAQVPDPSWKWAWKTWYVDMSHDVDEEGWEYSFSFQSRFVWHGSHPWFHSFARRRRWLRKRVKLHPARMHGRNDKMADAHRLNTDYFTIHGAKRDRSPESSAEGTLANQSSQRGFDGYQSDSEDDIDEITNVVALLAALKKATVDREKLAAVRAFIAQGGEELHYLGDSIGEIMNILIYQTSRQQLYEYLQKAASSAQPSRADAQNHDSLDKDDDDEEVAARKVENLNKAIQASKDYLKRLEYWRGLTERGSPTGLSPLMVPAFGGDGKSTAEQAKAHIEDEKFGNEIRGIPEGADISVAPSPLRTAQSQSQSSPDDTVSKGKEREH